MSLFEMTAQKEFFFRTGTLNNKCTIYLRGLFCNFAPTQQAKANLLEENKRDACRFRGTWGIDDKNIYSLTEDLLNYQKAHAQMAKASNTYGDSQAFKRIAEAILYGLGVNGTFNYK